MSPFDDDFFAEDPFENIVREFFGGRRNNNVSRKIIRGEEEEREIDFVESDGYVYLAFELPGFDENDIDVVVKGKELEIRAQKKECENVQDYLTRKLCNGIFIKKTLPKFINTKRFKKTMKNGVLELTFNKK